MAAARAGAEPRTTAEAFPGRAAGYVAGATTVRLQSNGSRRRAPALIGRAGRAGLRALRPEQIDVRHGGRSFGAAAPFEDATAQTPTPRPAPNPTRTARRRDRRRLPRPPQRLAHDERLAGRINYRASLTKRRPGQQQQRWNHGVAR